jgi:hypothetical protein
VPGGRQAVPSIAELAQDDHGQPRVDVLGQERVVARGGHDDQTVDAPGVRQHVVTVCWGRRAVRERGSRELLPTRWCGTPMAW